MACKYTYGNQVYDSLDDLKAAVKNDLQRSADKEEVVDNNTKIPIKIDKPSKGVELITDSGLTIQQANQFVDILAPVIAKSAAVENTSVNANYMFSFGKRWTRIIPTAGYWKSKFDDMFNTNSEFGSALASASQNIKSKMKVLNNYLGTKFNVQINPYNKGWSATGFNYGYDDLDAHGNPVESMTTLKPITEYIQSKLGIDLSNYDSVLANIYTEKQFIPPHRDTTEDVDAEGYAIVVINIGADGSISEIPSDYYNKTADKSKVRWKNLPVKNGGIYAFGVNGENRFNFFHAVNTDDFGKKTPTKPIKLPNGTVLTNYRITLTYRRATSPKDNGAPNKPARLASNIVDNNNQSNTATTKSDNISYKNNPTNLNTYLNYLGLKDIALNDAIFNAPVGAISKERVFLNTLQQIVENTPVLSAIDISEYVAKDKQKDLPDLKPLAQRIHALSMALSQNPSEKDLREYVKLNTELNAKIIELLTPHIKKVFGKDASIEYKTIRSVDTLYNPQQSNTTQQPKTTVTDAEVEAMTKALVEMYPEIEFGIENNPTFIEKEGVFNQQTNIKEGVPELFESNPELANAVYKALGFNQNNVEEFQGFWNRQQVASQLDKVFLFGDNTNDRTITKYVPSVTQAVIRGLSNAIGIDTKKDRGTTNNSYLTDNDFDWFKNHVDTQIQKAKNSGKTIVIPTDGIGTGKAMLKEKAPKLFEYLQKKLNELKESQITPQQKQQAQQLYSQYLATGKQDIQGFKEFVGNKQSRDQTDIQARKVLIDAAFKHKLDLVSHEFAHHYIAWFRNTPLVQQGIKMYDSEEALVQAIGEQAVVQRGKAWSWWKKFVAWLLNSANDVSDLTKENLRDILTDAFLSRQDLNKQAGTEAGVKLEKNVAVLGGETYLWNDNTGSWQPFTKSEADIEYSNDEMQKLMQEERDAKAQVKNDPVITPSWQTNTKEQLENRLLNTHKAIALNKANRYNLFASINTNETKRITDKDNLNISAKQKNKGSIVDPLTNLIAAIVMVGSKQGVGNLANVISARALLMFVNAHSNNTFKYSVGADAVKKEAIPIFLTPFGISKQDFQNLGDPNYSFGSLIDGDNRSVMFNSSEQITNEVDAVKNPVAIHLGYSQQNLNLIGYLTSLHITPEKIFTFLGERDSSGINFKSNNVTNKWALYVATNENMFHSGKTYTTEVEHEDYASGYNYTEYRKNQIELANNKLKQQFIADLLKEETNKFVRPDVSVTNYFEDIKNDEGRVVGTKLKYVEIERDGLTNQLLNNKVLKILYYWDLIEQAKQFMKSGKVIIADSHYSKSMNDALLQADSVEEQLNGKDISVISNSDLRGIIEGDQSIVSGFFSAQSKYKTYFLKYFFGHESIISRYLNDQLKLRYNKTSKEDLERLMNRAYSDLLVNILFKMQVIDPSISQGVFPKDSSGNTLTPEAMLHSKPASSNTKSTVYNIYRTLKQISGTTGKAQVLPKYSGITKSMATALLDILQFQLGVDGNRMASEDKVNKGEVVPADLVKLAEKVSNSATANNYIELFEEVKQLAPELFKEFTMISLYQAGFNNSPYNLFKAMPNTASTNDGIIDATAKATDAYSKFIKSVAKQLKQDSDLTQAELETDLHKEVVDEFLRWYDSQYGHFVAQDKNRAMFNDNTPIYRMYNSKAQKFDLYVIGARGFNETGTKIANRVAGAKNTVDFTKTVDKRYIPTAATVNDLASLGVLGEDAKVLIDNGIEVTKLCN